LVLSHLSLFPASPVETQISVTLGPISSSSWSWPFLTGWPQGLLKREVFILEKGVLWKEGDGGKTARRVVPKMFLSQCEVGAQWSLNEPVPLAILNDRITLGV
jgi:hypothetical protein